MAPSADPLSVTWRDFYTLAVVWAEPRREYSPTLLALLNAVTKPEELQAIYDIFTFLCADRGYIFSRSKCTTPEKLLRVYERHICRP